MTLHATTESKSPTLSKLCQMSSSENGPFYWPFNHLHVKKGILLSNFIASLQFLNFAHIMIDCQWVVISDAHTFHYFLVGHIPGQGQWGWQWGGKGSGVVLFSPQALGT